MFPASTLQNNLLKFCLMYTISVGFLKCFFFVVVLSRSPSERSGKGCCGQWFAGPPLRAVIFVVALGGLACALGGAALGATGLAGPPTSHFTAALLMTGIYINLLLKYEHELTLKIYYTPQ